MTSLLKPNALRPGDAIGVVVPAGPVNRERIDRALGRLEQRGFRPKMYGDIYRSSGYLAGDAATRANELMAAFTDPETRAVWCARGGFGVVHLLDRLDFNVIRSHPKAFIGFSDITVLHIAMQQRAGLVTFHGPNLQDGFGKPDDMPAVTETALWQVLSSTGAATSRNELCPAGGIEGGPLRAIHGGTAAGQLRGGNLAVLCGLMGTPYEIDTAGRILFIEDIGERLYRIDRYLSQLALAGKLSSAAGVLVGDFSYDTEDEAESPDAVHALLEHYLAPLGVPVLANFPAGHDKFNLALPMGAQVEIDADRRRVAVLESTVLD